MININEKGSGFDYFIRLTEFITHDTKELKSLLSYKDASMIEANKVRALADIDCSIANLKKKARNPTGFRRWDEWRMSINKNRRNYGDSLLILISLDILSRKPCGFRRTVVHVLN